MVTIEVDGLDEVNRLLKKYERRGNDLRPVLADIGEHMVNSTHDNFESSTTPDGTPWATNSETTFASMLGKRDIRKDGSIRVRGDRKVMNKSPLIQNRTLMQSISYEAGSRGVTIGTNMVYGAMMHYGGTKSAFPHLWGDIPARPFLGMKDSDKPIIENLIGKYLING